MPTSSDAGLWIRLHDGGRVRWRFFPAEPGLLVNLGYRGVHVCFTAGRGRKMETLIPWARVFEVRNTSDVYVSASGKSDLG